MMREDTGLSIASSTVSEQHSPPKAHLYQAPRTAPQAWTPLQSLSNIRSIVNDPIERNMTPQHSARSSCNSARSSRSLQADPIERRMTPTEPEQRSIVTEPIERSMTPVMTPDATPRSVQSRTSIFSRGQQTYESRRVGDMIFLPQERLAQPQPRSSGVQKPRPSVSG